MTEKVGRFALLLEERKRMIGHDWPQPDGPDDGVDIDHTSVYQETQEDTDTRLRHLVQNSMK